MGSLYAVIPWVINILELQMLHTRYKPVCFSCTNVRTILCLNLLGSFIASQLAEGALYFSIIAIFPCWLCVGSVICSFKHHLFKVTIPVSQIVLCNCLRNAILHKQILVCKKCICFFILCTLNYLPLDLLNFMLDLPPDHPTESVRFLWGVISTEIMSLQSWVLIKRYWLIVTNGPHIK